jgi:multiple sugar transport system substrate-binding protein
MAERAGVPDRSVLASLGLTRRRFLRSCAALGMGLGTASIGMPALAESQGAMLPEESDESVAAWLKDVGRGFRGSTVRMVTETTAPSQVIAQLAASEFTPATGISVEIELLPLERVLQRVTLDISSRTAQYDLYYLDQSWIARFAADTVDPREKIAENAELALPHYDVDDFMPALVDGISMYRGKMVGVPFDIPIFIMFYRLDILDDLGLSVPTTMDEYRDVVHAITAARAPDIYGSTGQMKAGHYSLNCEWTAWLWSHGGSIFDSEGRFAGGDEPGLRGLDYMLDLKRNMPPYVDRWTWDAQAESLLLGVAGVTLTWSEIFPGLDDSRQSMVPGLYGAAPPPRPAALRPPEECGFGEIPNIGHQGGSALALSRYSERADASWIFLQWATSHEIQTRASLLGGGGSPTRASVFDDPRVLAAAKVKAGTTRHFGAVRETIEKFMGSEPDLPIWPAISTGVIPRELGRLLEGGYNRPAEAMTAIAKEVDKLTEVYR